MGYEQNTNIEKASMKSTASERGLLKQSLENVIDMICHIQTE